MNHRHAVRTFAVVLVAAAAAAPKALDAEPDPGLPADAAWKDVAPRQFDPRWRLPSSYRPSLLGRLQKMLDVTFPAWEVGPGRPEASSTGDLVDELGRLRDDPRAQTRLLDRFRNERRQAHDALMPELSQLTRDGRLRTEDWEPDEDEADDGILLGKAFSLEAVKDWPWAKLEGSKDVHQGAAVYWADLDAIKSVENDYSAYMSHVDHAYEFIHALPDTYVRGRDPDGRPFSTLRIEFRCDLPFPYSTYDCTLRILNSLDRDGHLVTDIYSTSSDFYWMAGRDVFVPVRRSDDTWVATLAVRIFGFDLRSVPDGTDAREAAIRSTLGNLKRRAEVLFRRRGGTPVTVAGEVPNFRLRGLKR